MKNFIHTRTNRFRAFATTAAAIAVAVPLLLSGTAHAQPDQFSEGSSPVDVSTQYNGITKYNGYRIENHTGETLEYQHGSVEQQPEGSTCEGSWLPPWKTCTAWGEGFGKNPTEYILPEEKGYFDIPMYVYQGETYDHTRVTYMTSVTKRKISFYANASFFWIAGLPYSRDDNSSCAYVDRQWHEATNCVTTGSKGRGTQTIFEVYPPKPKP